jgi:hypothetical protein
MKTMIKINLFNVDVLNLRTERQKYNDELVYNLLTNKTNRTDIEKSINGKALERILLEEKMTYEQLLEQCVNPFITRSISRNISINASRQGKIDEKLIIDGISSVMSTYDINIKGCDVNGIRFCNDGRVLDGKSFKKENLDKDTDSMKSIDGIIEGIVNGYIFAKVVIGGGGHQDNVLGESIKFIDWVNKFGSDDKLYVVLVDGEDLSKIKNLEKENLWIVNHLELQKRLIELVMKQKREL